MDIALDMLDQGGTVHWWHSAVAGGLTGTAFALLQKQRHARRSHLIHVRNNMAATGFSRAFVGQAAVMGTVMGVAWYGLVWADRRWRLGRTLDYAEKYERFELWG